MLGCTEHKQWIVVVCCGQILQILLEELGFGDLIVAHECQLCDLTEQLILDGSPLTVSTWLLTAHCLVFALSLVACGVA